MEPTLKDKLPPAVTYNRPPTKQRAPDLGRFRSIDVQPDNAQNDPEYRRMVGDIEALQQRQGWLSGRGAFDKEDLLYLRDREQQERLTEQEQRDMEAAAYAEARARIEQQQREAANARLRAATAKQIKPHSKSFALVVKVKKHHGQDKQEAQSQQQEHHQHAGMDHQQGGREAKRQKLLDSVTHVGVVGSGTADSDRANVGKPGVQKASDNQPHQQQQQQAEEQPLIGTEHDKGNLPAPELQGLLGVYGSESESEEQPGTQGMQQQLQQQQQQQQCQGTVQECPHTQPMQLPSAAELLEQELHSSFAPIPCADAETDTPEVYGAGGAAPANQQQTAWI